MNEHFDVVVIGSGPAGQKAAIQAAKAGKRVLVVERDREVGGACVQRGTIPSKTLRETAVFMAGLESRCPGVFQTDVPEDVQLHGLMTRLDAVVKAHNRFMTAQLRRNGVECRHGRARFVSPHEIEIEDVSWTATRVRAHHFVIATGSRPRAPSGIPVDHEHVLDSDSILALGYLPDSLTVLGGGVIAAEYASIFAALGVAVTMVHSQDLPMGFLDRDLTARFVKHFESRPGCRFLGGRRIVSVDFDGVSTVYTKLDSGESIASEKALCALGRIANVDGLGLENAGVATDERGLIEVDTHCRTAVPHIYAVGDVIGPPSLAAASMEQGRRAMRHALGMEVPGGGDIVPTGIYTIPEMAGVGLTEDAARERHGDCVVGHAEFHELARAHISANTHGFLKLVADARGRKLLGAHVIGEGATELIHVAQMALITGQEVDVFTDNIFNFPTLAEAYRVAALTVTQRRPPAPVRT